MRPEIASGINLGLVYGLAVGVVFATAGRLELAVAAGISCAVLVTLGLAWAPARTRLPWWGLVVPLLSIPDLLLGSPSLVRVVLTTLLGLAAIAAGRLLEDVPIHASIRPHDRLVAFGLVMYALVGWLAISYKYVHFGDRVIAQDTGYFEQCFWGYVTGHNFFMGSSQAWWKYDPPLTSHFAMHCSPILFVVALFYRIWPSYHVLHLLQIVGITLAAVPIYLLVRRIDARAAALFCLAYLMNAAVLSQTQGAFHELAFAAPVVSWTVYFFLRQRLLPFLTCLVLALTVREDLALLICMAGVAAVLVRDGRARRLIWVGAPLIIGVVGWVVAGKVMDSFGRSGGQVIVGLFSRFGTTRAEIVLGMVRHPMKVLEMLVEGHRSRYLIGLLRPGLLGALVNPASLLILPVVVINLLVRGAGTAWLDVHYSVYLPAVLVPASMAVWLRWTPRLSQSCRATPAAFRSFLAVLMMLVGLLSLPDVLGFEQLRAYGPQSDEGEVSAVLAAIPPDAPAAVPRFMVHALAKRERLFMVNRKESYTRFDPEYIVVERDFTTVRLNDGTFEPYKAYAARLAADPHAEVLMRQPHYLLYRQHASDRAEPRVLDDEVPPETIKGDTAALIDASPGVESASSREERPGTGDDDRGESR